MDWYHYILAYLGIAALNLICLVVAGNKGWIKDNEEVDNQDDSEHGTTMLIIAILWIIVWPTELVRVICCNWLPRFVGWIGQKSKPNTPNATVRRLKR